MLSLKQLDDVCLVSDKGSGRCRYLTQDEVDPQKFYCLKLSPKSKKIDEEINSFIDTMKLKGRDPYAENLPFGDNCGGYPFLRHLQQGYDC